MNEAVFSRCLLVWFDRHGRKDLPWQRNRTAYRVWLSEVMLQQTQVKTVIPYFLKFTERFPDVAALAGAADDDVMSRWAGLGYYARARNLLRCARTVMTDFAGRFPHSVEQLQSLPGIGRSTAGAIVAQAYGKRGVILDGNVKRILTRTAAISGWPGKASVQRELWALADRLTPDERIADYTQAIMDLGATVCRRSKPLCTVCPLSKYCQAYLQDNVGEFPASKPGKKLPVRYTNMLICQYQGEILLVKRPPAGIWGGLWSLPELEDELDRVRLQCMLDRQLGLKMTGYSKGIQFIHTFSHFRLKVQPWYVSVQPVPSRIGETGGRFYAREVLPEVGMPRPVETLLRCIS